MVKGVWASLDFEDVFYSQPLGFIMLHHGCRVLLYPYSSPLAG
jgi:hypothetical protein